MPQRGEDAQADDPGTDHHHLIAVARRPAQEPVDGNGGGLVQARACVGHTVGKGTQHRRVAHDLLGPAPTEVRGVPEAQAGRQGLGAEVQAVLRPARRAMATRGLDTARHATDRGVHCDPGTRRDRAVGPRLDHPSRDLVSHHERKRGQRRERRRRPRPVAEEVQVAAADAAGGDRHPRPCGPGQGGLVEVDEGDGEVGIGEVEPGREHGVSLGRTWMAISLRCS